GLSENQVGILAHLDVVPAIATDWRHHPWQAEIDQGNLYGRGATDNKGPLIANLFAMKALAEMGLRLPKTVRLIAGCNEEKGFRCIEHYLANYPPPDCGFAPDASFPAIYGEKGMIHWDFCGEWPVCAEQGLQLISFSGGEANNIVPAKARVCFTADQAGYALLQNAVANSPQREQLAFHKENGLIIITASGIAAHASTPQLGNNAVTMLLRFLSGLPFAPTGAAAFIAKLNKLYADDCAGSTLGIQASDIYSNLTAVPSIIEIADGAGKLTTDCRFPVTHTVADYQRKITLIAQNEGLRLSNLQSKEPLFLPADSPIVRALLNIYQSYTGDLSAPLVSGGGTYARTMKNFIAFGAEFPGENCRIHQSDEFISCDQLRKLTGIYAEAIFALAYLPQL
ncbi:MAG: Sapep family Mn(2+)-dependent dipeptidase, partial [Clostridiales bacterium]